MKVTDTNTYKLLEASLSDKELSAIAFGTDETDRLVKALDRAYVNKSSISLPYWADQLGVEFMELFTFVCADLLDVVIKRKYASITINNRAMLQFIGSITKLIEYRQLAKLDRYMPRYVEDIQSVDLVKTPSAIKPTGLVRSGFAKSANIAYTYDIPMLNKYYDAILLNTQKSMRKIADKYPYVLEDSSGYAEISELVLAEIANDPYAKYNLEANISDQRGRSIYTALKRVFNPVGYKDARALMQITSRTITTNDREAIEAIYSAIAELSGFKRTRHITKMFAGMVAYKRRDLPQLDLATEDDRKDLHELIWLERIYAQLDTLFANGSVEWNVPIELDAGMSLAQIVGCITGDERLLNRTNVIQPNKLQDPWHIDNVRRLSAKKSGTPIFYGSSATVTSLLKKADIDIDKSETKAIRKEFSRGAFSVIKALKDALIKTSDVKTPSYTVLGYNETYTVEVNKSRVIDSELALYKVWDSKKNRIKTFFMHKPIRIPDYKRFKLFMATGFIHNLDSKVADTVCNTVDTIAIHDAFLCHPLDAPKVGAVYTDQLNQLYTNRAQILMDYRVSIGAIGPKADKAFRKVEELTQPISNFKACSSALK